MISDLIVAVFIVSGAAGFCIGWFGALSWAYWREVRI